MKQLMRIEPREFAAFFPDKPFIVQHTLMNDELFELPRLIGLARQLPERLVEYNSGTLPVDQDPTKTPRNGLSIAETIARIEDCKSWMVLKSVEQTKLYGDLLHACVDEVETLSRASLGASRQREGFVFISSPNSVTPYHMDPEHNFLLQIRGHKTVYVFDGNDRSLLSEEELESFYGGGHRNLKYRDEYYAKARSFVLNPGDALYVPVNHPHWVQNGAAVSISFSITFRSAFSERRAKLFFINRQIRKMGLHPGPVGRREWLDAAKYTAYRLCLEGKRLVRRRALRHERSGH